jgi:hypothetical protein
MFSALMFGENAIKHKKNSDWRGLKVGRFIRFDAPV